jgi:hypothetical protein
MKSEPDCRNIHVQTSFFNLQLEEKGAPVQISEEKYMHRATEIDFAWQSEAEISRCVWRRSGPPPPRRTEQRWPFPDAGAKATLRESVEPSLEVRLR